MRQWKEHLCPVWVGFTSLGHRCQKRHISLDHHPLYKSTSASTTRINFDQSIIYTPSYFNLRILKVIYQSTCLPPTSTQPPKTCASPSPKYPTLMAARHQPNQTCQASRYALLSGIYNNRISNLTSPSLTPAPTNKKKSNKLSKISLFQTNHPSPATGTHSTSEPSTLAPVVSKAPFRAKATALFVDRLL